VGPRDELVGLLEAVYREAERVVGLARPADLARPTPCREWDLARLLNHLTGAVRTFTVLLGGGRKDPAYNEHDWLGADPAGAFAAAVAENLAAWRAADPALRFVEADHGRVPVALFLISQIREVFVHTTDVARALGVPVELPDAVVATIHERSVKPMRFRDRTGSFAEAVAVPAGASAQDRLLALFGRAPDRFARLTLLVVHAHPDDEASHTGGVLARYAAEGVHTVVVTCTTGSLGTMPGGVEPGDPGHDEAALIRLRAAELAAALRALRVGSAEMLGYRDSGMPGWPENERAGAFARQPLDAVADRLVELFERHRPDVVVTDQARDGDNHPDHVHASRATARAAERSGIPRKLYYAARPVRDLARLHRALQDHGLDGGAPGVGAGSTRVATPPRVLVPRDDRLVTTRVDVRGQAHQKHAALAAYRSQLDTSPVMRLPLDAWTEAFGWESFIRAHDTTGAPVPEDDLFAGLRSS
jgi:uncharacterized protein (TIGR03086 family)